MFGDDNISLNKIYIIFTLCLSLIAFDTAVFVCMKYKVTGFEAGGRR